MEKEYTTIRIYKADQKTLKYVKREKDLDNDAEAFNAILVKGGK